LRHAEWIEFDIDGCEPLWRIPADKMKMGARHIVPLSTQALILLRELHSVTGRAGDQAIPVHFCKVSFNNRLVVESVQRN
jgi:integrase